LALDDGVVEDSCNLTLSGTKSCVPGGPIGLNPADFTAASLAPAQIRDYLIQVKRKIEQTLQDSNVPVA
jgi:hypothetical protein